MAISIKISKHIFICGSPIFYLSRVLGLLPFVIKIKNAQYILTYSVKYNILSILFGILLIVCQIYGVIADLRLRRDTSGELSSTKTEILECVNVFIIMFIVATGIFGSAFNVKYIFHILNSLNQIDDILLTENSEKIRKINIRQLNAIILFIISFIIFHFCVEDSLVAIYHLIYFFLFVIVLIMECQYLQLLAGVERRFLKLSNCLKNEIEINTNTLEITKNTEESRLITFLNKKEVNFSEKLYVNEFSKPRHKTIFVSQAIETNIKQRISKLNIAHSKLFEVVDNVNNCYGFLVLVIIVSCLFHLVTMPYFLLLDLLAENATTLLEFILQSVWIVLHLIRLLLIVQPCHATQEQASSVNRVVSNLLCSNIDSQYIPQLHLFSIQLLHRKIEFSAFGLCTIDRSLLSTIAGAVTTYLVILLQFR